MAAPHIYYSKDASHAHLISRPLDFLEKGLDFLNAGTGSLQLMIDGDGSQAAHYAYMNGKIGTATDADAKALYEELLSLKGKLTTDASVSNVHAALRQAFNKLR